jgi:hypothetical protein
MLPDLVVVGDGGVEAGVGAAGTARIFYKFLQARDLGD